jgi:hypothetical protein
LDRNAQRELLQYVQDKLSSSDNKSDLNVDHLLLQLRKIREALLANRSHDEFTLKVYRLSLDLALRSENHGELTKTLHFLTHDMDQPEPEFISMYMLYHSLVAFVRRSSPHAVFSFFTGLSLNLRKDPEVHWSLCACKALAFHFDYIRFGKMIQRLNADVGKLVSLFESDLQARAFAVMRRSYFHLTVTDLQQMLKRCIHTDVEVAKEDIQEWMEDSGVPRTHWINDKIYFKKPPG